MKINDITRDSNIVIEAFIDGHDIATAAKSIFKNLINVGGLSFQDLRSRMMKDRGVTMTARALLQWWKEIRYSLTQAYGFGNERDSYLEQILTEKIKELGANETAKVKAAKQTILQQEDNLNSNQVINAFFDIVANAIASKISISAGVGQLKPPTKAKYGGYISEPEIRKAIDNRVPGTKLPVIVFNNVSNEYRKLPAYRLIKFDGRWYIDTAQQWGLSSNRVVLDTELEHSYEVVIQQAIDSAVGQNRSDMVQYAGIEVPDSYGQPDEYQLITQEQYTIYFKLAKDMSKNQTRT